MENKFLAPELYIYDKTVHMKRILSARDARKQGYAPHPKHMFYQTYYSIIPDRK